MKLQEAVAFLSEMHIPPGEMPVITVTRLAALELAGHLAVLEGPPYEADKIFRNMKDGDMIVSLCGVRIRSA